MRVLPLEVIMQTDWQTGNLINPLFEILFYSNWGPNTAHGGIHREPANPKLFHVGALKIEIKQALAVHSLLKFS